MALYRVTAPAAVINANTKDERYLYRKAVFDDAGVTNLEHLLDLGFIELVIQRAVVEGQDAGGATDADPPTDPAADSFVVPTDRSTIEQIKEYLLAKGIPFDGITSKGDLLALAQQ